MSDLEEDSRWHDVGPNLPQLFRPHVWRTKLTVADPSQVSEAVRHVDPLSLGWDSWNTEEIPILFAHESSSNDVIGLERTWDLISNASVVVGHEIMVGRTTLGEDYRDENGEQIEEQIKLKVISSRDLLDVKEKTRRQKQVTSLLRGCQADNIGMRLGPFPRNWFIPDGVFEGKSKKFLCKPKPLFPQSHWMKFFQTFGEVKKAMIHPIDPETKELMPGGLLQIFENNPDDNERIKLAKRELPQAYIVIQYSEEECQTAAEEFHGLYLQNHLTQELRPTNVSIVDPEKPFYKAPEEGGELLSPRAKRAKLYKQAKERENTFLANKPQFKEIQVEKKEDETYGGISTLGMNDHQRKAFKACFDRVKQLDAENSELTVLITKLKKEEMLSEMRLAEETLQQEKKKRRKKDKDAPWKKKTNNPSSNTASGQETGINLQPTTTSNQDNQKIGGQELKTAELPPLPLGGGNAGNIIQASSTSSNKIIAPLINPGRIRANNGSTNGIPTGDENQNTNQNQIHPLLAERNPNNPPSERNTVVLTGSSSANSSTNLHSNTNLNGSSSATGSNSLTTNPLLVAPPTTNPLLVAPPTTNPLLNPLRSGGSGGTLSALEQHVKKQNPTSKKKKEDNVKDKDVEDYHSMLLGL